MKRISHFTHKDVQGKKIREQHFIHILLAVYLAIVIYFIYSLKDPEALGDTLMACLIFFVISSPLIVLSILNQFCIGRVLCVLMEDRLAFFNAYTIVDKRHSYSTGYLLYSAIQEIQYLRRDLKNSSCMVISGKDFQIIIRGAGRRLARELEKVRYTLAKSSAEDSLFLCVDENEGVRTGLFKEIWEAYDNGSLLKIFDEKTEIDHADSDGKEISMIMERNGNIIDFTIDEKSIYLISDNNDRDETRSFQPDTTLQDVCDWMTQFLIENTENAES